jgi:hypothetical protein
MRPRFRDLAPPVPAVQTYFLQGNGDTSGLGGSFQDVPGLSQVFPVLKGQIVLMQASVAVYGGGNDSNVFWTMITAAGTFWPAGQITGTANSGHVTVPAFARYVAIRDESIQCKVQACTPSGGGGQVFANAGRSNALIQVLTPTP